MPLEIETLTLDVSWFKSIQIEDGAIQENAPVFQEFQCEDFSIHAHVSECLNLKSSKLKILRARAMPLDVKIFNLNVSTFKKIQIEDFMI